MNTQSYQMHSIPLYCPNSRCLFHFGSETTFYVKNGFVQTDKPPHYNQRYRCKGCRSQFSDNTFGIDFRKKLTALSESVLHFSMNGMSNNSIAGLLDVAESTVRDRLKVMARQALLFEKEHVPSSVDEDVAYDGFETFTHSQFSPCYINTAVGSRSHFVYHNTFSPLNRKGRMTELQKQKNRELIQQHGCYPQSSVYEESCYIMKNISQLAPGMTLYTDEHRAYTRAARSINLSMKHVTISSLERRDQHNPLFPINRLHNLYRHYFSSQHRETIAFQKHEAALLEKMQLMKIYRNYMNPKFKKKNAHDRHAHEWSPAMYLGLSNKVLGFREVFASRKLKTQIRLDTREMRFIERQYPFSRQVIAV